MYISRWYCKRKCETWPVSLLESNFESVTNPFDFEHNCSYNQEVQAQKGCFQFDEYDHPGTEVIHTNFIYTIPYMVPLT